MYDAITLGIENLATALHHEDDLVKIWAVAHLASRLNVVAALSNEDDAVEAITDIGESWADMVEQQLHEQPDRRGDTLRASHAVVQRLLRGINVEDRPPATALRRCRKS